MQAQEKSAGPATDSEENEAEEAARRMELAACYRLVDLYDMSDGIGTHISSRVPGRSGEFLINPYGWLFDEITASSLIRVNSAGKALTDQGRAVNPAGFNLHSCLHQSRADVVCVLHTHTVAGMAVGALADGLLPLTQHAMQFYGRIGYHDYEGLVTRREEQERLAAALGEHKALVLRHHGLVTVGASVAEAFYLMWRLEKACRAQVDILASGREVLKPDLDAVQRTSDTYWYSSRVISDLAWAGFRRQLDRIAPDYQE